MCHPLLHPLRLWSPFCLRGWDPRTWGLEILTSGFGLRSRCVTLGDTLCHPISLRYTLCVVPFGGVLYVSPLIPIWIGALSVYITPPMCYTFTLSPQKCVTSGLHSVYPGFRISRPRSQISRSQDWVSWNDSLLRHPISPAVLYMYAFTLRVLHVYMYSLMRDHVMIYTNSITLLHDVQYFFTCALYVFTSGPPLDLTQSLTSSWDLRSDLSSLGIRMVTHSVHLN